MRYGSSEGRLRFRLGHSRAMRKAVGSWHREAAPRFIYSDIVDVKEYGDEVLVTFKGGGQDARPIREWNAQEIEFMIAFLTTKKANEKTFKKAKYHHEKMHPWNQFRHEYGYQGLSRQQLRELYYELKKQKTVRPTAVRTMDAAIQVMKKHDGLKKYADLPPKVGVFDVVAMKQRLTEILNKEKSLAAEKHRLELVLDDMLEDSNLGRGFDELRDKEVRQ